MDRSLSKFGPVSRGMETETSHRQGVFEIPDDRAIFLVEIADLPMRAQGTLLLAWNRRVQSPQLR